MNICPRTLKITAECEFLGSRCTETFEDWIHNGILYDTAEKVAEDYFYEYFDKGPYKIIEIENISIDW